MKIFSAEQIRAWDRYTILHEPISSIDLMERAARACTDYLLHHFPQSTAFHIVCGPGNNGGDGLAIARHLVESGVDVQCFADPHLSLTAEHTQNRDRLIASGGTLSSLEAILQWSPGAGDILIDAIFGIGQSRAPGGFYLAVIEKMNSAGVRTIAIDIPSGMYADQTSAGNVIVRAQVTLTFQCMKLAMFMPENAPYLGEVKVLNIGLHPCFERDTQTAMTWTMLEDVRGLVKSRDPFAHKGQFGSALLLAGNREMMGAAILAAKACLRTGAGKLFCRIPGSGQLAMQTALPEAITLPDPDPDCLSSFPELEAYSAIGVGPGLGTSPVTAAMLGKLVNESKQPLVADADALNLISAHKLQGFLKPGTVLTPHIGEFHRLFESAHDGFSRIRTAIEFSTRCEICIIIKGRYSFLSTPGGRGYFNSTGNPGMAKAGSGDVLTGIILGLLAQKYSTDEASRLGIYLHGLAGDLARDELGEQAVLASDIVDRIGKAFQAILLILVCFVYLYPTNVQ